MTKCSTEIEFDFGLALFEPSFFFISLVTSVEPFPGLPGDQASGPSLILPDLPDHTMLSYVKLHR